MIEIMIEIKDKAIRLNWQVLVVVVLLETLTLESESTRKALFYAGAE